MIDRLKGGIFTEAKSRWELQGWHLRKFRLQIGKTQKQFSVAAGWGRPYQAMIENCSYAMLMSNVSRLVVEGVFLRFQQQDKHAWNTNMKSCSVEPKDLVAKIFVEHKRYQINADQLSNAIDSRAARRNFALLSGWSMEYVRQLCRGVIGVVNEQAALKIAGCLISLQDIEQI